MKHQVQLRIKMHQKDGNNSMRRGHKKTTILDEHDTDIA